MQQSPDALTTPYTKEELKLQKIENALKNLRVADIEIFISAARMKSLSNSAKINHLSQSAASAAIQRVEAAFATELCMHERRQFRLTRQGERILPKLEQVIQELRELSKKREDVQIKLVTTHAIAQVAVPSLISIPNVSFRHMRPDHAYASILHGESDIALVLDNAPWKGTIASEISKGFFQLYCRKKAREQQPILLPEDQIEVLSLQQSWQEVHNYPIEIKARIPSWSLIAQICASSDEVGFLPDFLAQKYGLHPVDWQPSPSRYRILAIYKHRSPSTEKKYSLILNELQLAFL